MMPAGLSSLAAALLHSLWQGALVWALAWLAVRVLLVRRPASTHFAVLHGAVWLVVIAFGWTWAALWASDARALAMTPATAMAATAPIGAAILPWLVLGAWAAGAAWHAARVAVGLGGVARWRRDAEPLSAIWSQTLDVLRHAIGVSRTVEIGARAGLDVPVVFGAWRPMVLVPLAWAAGVPTPVMRAALAHELAHVLRHDYAVQLALHLIESLFYFHPGVRWMLAQLRVLRELACDEIVVARVIDPLDYARALTELELTRVPDAPALAANGAPLVQRIEHLVSLDRIPARASTRTPLATAILAAAIATMPAVLAFSCQLENDAMQAPGGSDADEHAAGDDAEPTERVVAEPTAVIAVPWLRDALATHARAIDAAAKQHGVDPSLLAIVTWVESRGDARAKSPMGARGLMQLMPATAARIASARGIAEHRAERLDDPSYNLDLGAYHLAELLATYGGGDEVDADVVGLAAVAYNGGSRRAEAWLGGAPLPDETARYREVVVAMWQARHDAKAPTID